MGPNNFLFKPSGGAGGATANGSSGVNYVSAIFAGDTFAGINQYDDGASSSPTNGTGGSPVGLTTALNTSTPLVGASSLRFSKDAADRQGEGWSYDFTVDSQSYDQSNPLYIQFYYRTSAAFASSDMRVFVYDVTNGTLLTVNDISNNSGNIIAATGDAQFTGVFYTVAAASSYRLIWHIASTNASAYDIDLDNITVSPNTSQPGYIGSYLGSEVWADNQANATSSAQLWRNGQWVTARITTTFTGVASGQITLTIPAAYTADAIYNTATVNNVGNVTFLDAGVVGNIFGTASIDTTANTLNIYATLASGTYTNVTNTSATVPFTWANTDSFVVTASWKVSGWAASAALSSTEIMFSTAVAKASGNPASAADGAPIIWPTENWDNTGSYSTSTGQFTAPRTARYAVKGFISGATAARTVYAYVNAVQGPQVCQLDSNGQAGFAVSVEATKGQTIDIRPVGGALDVGSGSVYFEEIPDFSIFSVWGQTELLPATGYSSSGLTNYVITAGNFGDLHSVSLTPGEWDCFINADYFSNGVVTTTEVGVALSTFSGNDSTGLLDGDNFSRTTKSATTGTHSPLSFSKIGIVVTTPTTYYFKSRAVTSITNLQIGWSWRFRRVK